MTSLEQAPSTLVNTIMAEHNLVTLENTVYCIRTFNISRGAKRNWLNEMG